MKFKQCQRIAAISALLLSSLAHGQAPDPCNYAADPRYSVAVDFVTVTDNATGLVWKRCSEGLSGTSCADGTASSFTWQGALAAASGDWRLPNRNELSSLLERQCSSPAINAAVFPGTPVGSYWSSSPFALDPGLAWAVDFNVGNVVTLSKTASRIIRLVRAGN